MCIIILDSRTESDEVLDREILHRSRVVNPDGLGMMWAENGVLHTWRHMTDLDGLYKRYCEVREKKLKVALHFRLTTKGTTSLKNCHPFVIVKNQFAFMHNGTIKPAKSLTKAGQSDTHYFNEHVLQKLPGNFLNNPLLTKSVRDLIDGDRMLFMDFNGNHTIINPKRWGANWEIGEENNGVWFSKGKELDYIVRGKERKAWLHGGGGWNSCGVKETPEAPKKLPLASSSKQKRITGQKWWHECVSGSFKEHYYTDKKEESKDEDKDVEWGTYMVFDYGFLDRSGFEVNPERLIHCGPATLSEHQLWALGCAASIGQPGAIRTPGSKFKTKGNVFCITDEDPTEILELMDQYYGCELGRPENSVYHRSMGVVKMPGGGDTPAWVYRYCIPLSEVNTSGAVPFGDWDEWERRKEVEDMEKGIDKLFTPSSNPRGIMVVNQLRPGAVGYYQCPICDSHNTEVFSVYPIIGSAKDNGQLEDRLLCNSCSSESLIEIEAN